MKVYRSIVCTVAWLIIGIPLAAQPAFIEMTIDTNVTQVAALTMGDLNGDSLWDIVCASAGNTATDYRGVVAYLATDSNARHWTTLYVDSLYYRPLGVDVADLDGDSAPDIIGCSWDSGSVDWWHNDGGTPVAWTRYAVTNQFAGAHELHAADVNQDGHPDIIAAGAVINQVAVWFNDGQPAPGWTKQAIDDGAPAVRSATAADFDGDGDVDLAAAIYDANQVAWYRNDGGWPITWTKCAIDAAFPLSHQVTAVDIDRDGRIDLLGAGYGGQVAWWRNTVGDPIVWEKQVVYTGSVGRWWPGPLTWSWTGISTWWPPTS